MREVMEVKTSTPRAGSMYAEQANKLVLDAKRIQKLRHLPPYAATTVRAVTKEVRDLDREVSNLLAPFQTGSTQGSDGSQIKSSNFNPAEDPATACALLVNHLSMRRNKRCLLAYHRVRTDKLEELCWSGVDVADLQTAGGASSNQSDTTSSLSAEEEQYMHQYSNLLAAYKGQWTDIDLTGSLEPPKDIFIDVRVLKDAGEIQTEYGSITLTKNSQFYVRQADVERLIQQGYLQKLG
ncbi:DNA replication protein psf1 [Elasticomyces elasticus]|nr:DNA replication protein psf1 [Elasticomyces elasticus]